MQPKPEGAGRVLVAISGGVDSFVAAALLRNQGYEVQGVHIEMGVRPEGFQARCCRVDVQALEKHREELARICERIGIPLVVIPAEGRFEDRVIDTFVHDILELRLPHPCLGCTHRVRFDLLFQALYARGFDYLATGHYAQVTHDLNHGPSRLSRAIDRNKDQSHWLFELSQDRLKNLLLPLGGLPQSMVRRLAGEFGLELKPDVSEVVCAVGMSDGEDYRDFVQSRVAPSLRPTGLVRSTDGSVVGEHKGFHRYSLGQSKDVPGAGRGSDPYVVVGGEHVHNLLVVGPPSRLFKKELLAARTRWVRPVDGLRGTVCTVRLPIRPGAAAEELPCRLTVFENASATVDLGHEARFVPPGQPLVFYENDEVLGGGYAERSRDVE